MITIAGHEIGKRPFTIAEVGINHNGSLDRALEMIGAAKACGVDAVKFQTFKAEGVCSADQMYTYHQRALAGSEFPEPLRSILEPIIEPRIDIFKRCQLPDFSWWVLKKECEKRGVVFMSTPQNPSDLDLLLKVGIPAIKIGSDDATNHEMLRYCAAPDIALPVILSSGMCYLDEIVDAIRIVGHQRLVLMVCTSSYPCLPNDVNLGRFETLRFAFPLVTLGFSDHTTGRAAAAIAATMGACVFECHFTLDHNLPGPDHWWSRNVSQLRAWVDAIHEAHVMLGDGVVRPSAAELEAKAKYQRTVPA